MARGRREAAWGRTSSLMALIANRHRGKGEKKYRPADFNPLCMAESMIPPEESWRALKQEFAQRKDARP